MLPVANQTLSNLSAGGRFNHNIVGWYASKIWLSIELKIEDLDLIRAMLGLCGHSTHWNAEYSEGRVGLLQLIASYTQLST